MDSLALVLELFVPDWGKPGVDQPWEPNENTKMEKKVP